MDYDDTAAFTRKPVLEDGGKDSSDSAKDNKQDDIRILVVIRPPIIRFALACLLNEQSDFNVVGTAGNCVECCQKAQGLAPNVLLCDLDTAEACPAKASCTVSVETVFNAFPDLPAILLHDDDKECQILDASRIGIRGYLTTNTSPEELFQAIRVVKNGGTFLDRRMQSRLMGMLSQMNGEKKTEDEHLNDRERSILHLLAQGKRNHEIADFVFLSNSSVKRYVSTLYAKLGASNRAEAVRIGISKNLIDFD